MHGNVWLDIYAIFIHGDGEKEENADSRSLDTVVNQTREWHGMIEYVADSTHETHVARCPCRASGVCEPGSKAIALSLSAALQNRNQLHS